MAGADYVTCDACGQKVFYSPDRGLEEVSQVYCDKCYNKLKKRLEKLLKIMKKKGYHL